MSSVNSPPCDVLTHTHTPTSIDGKQQGREKVRKQLDHGLDIFTQEDHI